MTAPPHSVQFRGEGRGLLSDEGCLGQPKEFLELGSLGTARLEKVGLPHRREQWGGVRGLSEPMTGLQSLDSLKRETSV